MQGYRSNSLAYEETIWAGRGAHAILRAPVPIRTALRLQVGSRGAILNREQGH